MRTRLLILLALLCLSGMLPAVQVQVPLPGLCGNYTAGMTPRSVNLNCGTTFKRIDSVSVYCSGSVTPGLAWSNGVEGPPGYVPLEGAFIFEILTAPYNWHAGTGLQDGPFTAQDEFGCISGNWNFLLDGQAQISTYLSPAVGFFLTPIYPPTGSINEAHLVIDGLIDWIEIQSPQGGDVCAAGSMQTVSWLDHRAPAVPPRLYWVEFSADDGQTWTALNVDPVEMMPLSWTPPVINSQQCRIRVIEAADPTNTAISGPFTTFICAKELPFDINLNPDCYINMGDFTEFAQRWLAPEGFVLDDLLAFAADWLDCGNPYDPLCGL